MSAGLGVGLGSEEVKSRLMRSNQLLLFSLSMPPTERASESGSGCTERRIKHSVIRIARNAEGKKTGNQQVVVHTTRLSRKIQGNMD